jgi:hypothetical protein
MRSRLPPRVCLIGPPAAGKSLARDYARTCLFSLGFEVELLELEECLRELFSPGKEDGTFYYENEGGLVLLDRPNQIPKAWQLLKQRCENASTKNGYILELADWDVARALIRIAGNSLPSALTIFLTAPTKIRLQRNRRRTKYHVPEEIVVSIPEALHSTDIAMLLERKTTLSIICTTSSKKLLYEQLDSLILGYFSFQLLEEKLT